jgi:tetratricopeptide (TPR) repeat protein
MNPTLKRALPYLLLAAAVTAVWLPSLSNNFTNWDDNVYVYENNRIFHLNLTNLSRILNPTTRTAEDWTPFVTITHAIEYQIVGLEPTLYHATNILMHVGATLLTFALFLHVGVPMAVAFAGALIFGIHPLQAESVVWISGRKNLLSTLFGFGAILVYLRDTPRSYRWSIALMVLSALCKGIAIVIPPLLVLTLLFSGRDVRWSREAVRLAPLFFVALLRGLATVSFQEDVWARTAAFSLLDRMLVMGGVLSTYLQQFFWPTELRAFYGWSPRLANPWLPFAWLPVLGLSALVAWGARRARWVGYLGLFVPLTLFPMLNLFPAPFFQADRYLYMSIPAGAALLAAALYVTTDRLSKGWLPPTVLALWCGLVLAPATLRQIPVWQDSYALWNHTLRYEPTWHVAFNNLGLWYTAQGDLEQAARQYEQALAVRPNFFESRLNLAHTYYRTDRDPEAEAILRKLLLEEGDALPKAHHGLAQVLHKREAFIEAEQEYRRSLALDPENLEAITNLGTLIYDLGRISEALVLYDQAIYIRPDDAAVRNNRGNALRLLGRLPEAEAEIRRAVEIDPDYADAHSNLGAVLVDMDRPRQAIPSFQKALDMDPELHAAASNLGNAYFAIGDLESALIAYERALEIEPDFAEALNNSGNALSTLGRFEEAKARYLRALELRADFPEAKYGLGRLYLATGKPKQAVPLLKEAHRQRPGSVEGAAFLAHAAWQSGDRDLAAQSFAEVIRLQPGRIPAYQNLARLLGEMGRRDDAEMLLRKAISMIELPDLLEQLAILLEADASRTEEVEQLRTRVRELRAGTASPTPGTKWARNPQAPPR